MNSSATSPSADDSSSEAVTADGDADRTISLKSQEETERESESESEPRTVRAREEEMDVALLKQGGIYEVEGTSGTTYRVDITTRSCTCPDADQHAPDGGCKHVRRVALELEAGIIPRPDGKLPDVATSLGEVDTPFAEFVERVGGRLDNGDSPKKGSSETIVDYQQEQAAIIDAMQEREESIARLQAEIEALEFVAETLETLADPDAEFSLDAIRPDHEW